MEVLGIKQAVSRGLFGQEKGNSVVDLEEGQSNFEHGRDSAKALWGRERNVGSVSAQVAKGAGRG